MQALLDGTTVRQAARRGGVHKNTSFRWRHRFLTRPPGSKPLHWRGMVEADETYFLASFKAPRHLPRPARKHGGVAGKRGRSAEQTPVLIVRDRRHTTIGTVLAPILDPDAVRCSDGAASDRSFATQATLAHPPINLSAGIRVLDHAFHLQNVHADDSRLKGWMARFYGVATNSLPNDLGWPLCRERFGEALTPETLLAQAVGRGSRP